MTEAEANGRVFEALGNLLAAYSAWLATEAKQPGGHEDADWHLHDAEEDFVAAYLDREAIYGAEAE